MSKPIVASFFSGIGGFDLAFEQAGFQVELLCDIDPLARKVLKKHFPDVRLSKDITQLKHLPKCDVVLAGWPCQDLSQAGRTAGLRGDKSSLILDVFRLLDTRARRPSTLVLENVAFALALSGGAAMRAVARGLEDRGYNWAYRVLDTRHFGLPQRRRRVYVLATLADGPEHILFDGVHNAPEVISQPNTVGFYWTEGNRGVGWTPDAVPPLKAGSAFSIPSPPAVWTVGKPSFVTPSIEDAERLQGFDDGWTEAGDRTVDRERWRLVGNAISVPVARWVAQRIADSALNDRRMELPSVMSGQVGHNAAWGGPGREPRYLRRAFEGPSSPGSISLTDFVLRSPRPLSLRAAKGFLGRYQSGGLSQNAQFAASLTEYCHRLQ